MGSTAVGIVAAFWAIGNDPRQRWTQWTASPSPPDRGTVGANQFGLVRTVLDLALDLHLPPSSGIGGL